MELSPALVVALFDELGAQLAQATNSVAVLQAIVDLAPERVPAADYAGVTVGRRNETFETIAASHDRVLTCDKIQYSLGSGPCVDAVVADKTFLAADLRTDPRWPVFGQRCVEETGIVSMLSMRLYIEADGELIAGLNLYSHQPKAFDDDDVAVAYLLATHGALAMGKARAEEKVRNLEKALENSREIGIAIGVLMAHNQVTREEAFSLLRISSQREHRKLADVAAEVAHTGLLPGR